MFKKMLGSAFALVFVTLLVLQSIVTIVAIGYNRITGDIAWSTGWRAFTDMFGGLTSFWATLLVIVILLAFAAAAYVVADKQFSSDSAKAGVAAAAVGLLILAAIIGTRWVRMPSGSGLAFLSFIGLAAVFTVVIMTIFKRTATPAVATTS